MRNNPMSSFISAPFISKPHPKSKHRGMTLVEGMIYLAIAAFVLVAAVGLIKKALSSSDVSKEQQALVELMTLTPQLRSTDGYGSSGTNLIPQLEIIGAIPSTMSLVGDSLYNTWGGEIAVTSTGMGYRITDQSVPQEPCVKIAKMISATNEIKTSINSGSAVRGEVSTAQAVQSCSNEDENTIVIEALR